MSLRAKLLFDSARAGAAIGLRALGACERSLLYAAGDVAVDMVVFESARGVHVVHGQLVDARTERPVADAEVRLGPESVRTDPYGQFAVSSVEALAGCSLHVRTGDAEFACPVPGDDPGGEERR